MRPLDVRSRRSSLKAPNLHLAALREVQPRIDQLVNPFGFTNKSIIIYDITIAILTITKAEHTYLGK
jgi:hypothetical protein